jgi:hypothetical protein
MLERLSSRMSRALLVAAMWLLSGCSGSTTMPDAGSDSALAEDAPAWDAGTDAGGGGFGDPCMLDEAAPCADGSFCLAGPSGGSVGFCTHTCPRGTSGACPGAPEGTTAYCVVTDVNAAGDKGCAFLCEVGGTTYTCPGELTCSPTQEPPGSGQRLCLP